MSTLAVPGRFLSWVQLGGTKIIQPEFCWVQKREEKEKEGKKPPHPVNVLSPGRLSPDALTLCSHWPEIGGMCPFLEGVSTFMLCLR